MLYMGSQILRYAERLIVDSAKKKKNIPRKKYVAKWKVRYFPWLDLREQNSSYFGVFCKYVNMQEYTLLHMTI